MKIGVKVLLFNFKMREARKLRKLTQKELAELLSTNVQSIQCIEALKRPPMRLWKCIELLDKIAWELGFETEELFDKDYLELIIERNIFKGENWSSIHLVYEHKLGNLLSSNFHNDMLLGDGLDVIDHKIDVDSLGDALEEAIEWLPPKEASVLRLRFGLHGNDPHTFKQIAEKMNVTKERIRQIEAQALRRLRNPRTFRTLREYI